MAEKLFPDIKKVVAAPVVQAVVDPNKPKSFFDGGKGQNLFIMLSRLPKAEVFLTAMDNLNEKSVSQDHL
mgnify:CR=1 FL=1